MGSSISSDRNTEKTFIPGQGPGRGSFPMCQESLCGVDDRIVSCIKSHETCKETTLACHGHMKLRGLCNQSARPLPPGMTIRELNSRMPPGVTVGGRVGFNSKINGDYELSAYQHGSQSVYQRQGGHQLFLYFDDDIFCWVISPTLGSSRAMAKAQEVSIKTSEDVEYMSQSVTEWLVWNGKHLLVDKQVAMWPKAGHDFGCGSVIIAGPPLANRVVGVYEQDTFHQDGRAVYMIEDTIDNYDTAHIHDNHTSQLDKRLYLFWHAEKGIWVVSENLGTLDQALAISAVSWTSFCPTTANGPWKVSVNKSSPPSCSPRRQSRKIEYQSEPGLVVVNYESLGSGLSSILMDRLVRSRRQPTSRELNSTIGQIDECDMGGSVRPFEMQETVLNEHGERVPSWV